MMTTAAPSAFLSVRVPERTRDRLKAVAAARGETVQGLVGHLVERFLVEEGRKPPALAEIIATLRSHGSELKGRGISGLWVFGSVARGDTGPDSDIDVFAEFAPDAPLSLVGLASLRADLSEMVGVPVDLVERNALRPDISETAERDAVRVL